MLNICNLNINCVNIYLDLPILLLERGGRIHEDMEDVPGCPG